MTFRDDPLLTAKVGGRSIGEALDSAIEAGAVLLHHSGKVYRPAALSPPDESHEGAAFFQLFRHQGDFRQPCNFLNNFLFDEIYNKATVPFGCRDCYKVKVTTTSFRQTRAIGRLAKTVSQTSKTGAEQATPATGLQFNTYFFNLGLDRARSLHADLRARIDQDPDLGPAVTMLIKRGCSNYEAHCGPSDRYVFDPALEQAEHRLSSLFARKRKTSRERLNRRLRRLGGYVRIIGVVLRDRLGLLPRAPNAAPPAIVSYPADPPQPIAPRDPPAPGRRPG
jgi:hypothetical protein